MSPDELRRTATRIREDYPDTPIIRRARTPLMLAVADLLEKMARSMVGTSAGEVPFEAEVAAIARAYQAPR